MDLPDIREMDVKGKRVLVRANLNVPIEGGEIADDSRLRAALPTFRDIVDRSGRLIVISHLDRPGGKRDPSVSLRSIAEALDEMLDGTTVAFAEDPIGCEARAAVDALTDGDCVVM
jgi:phosphoglycerate kinase